MLNIFTPPEEPSRPALSRYGAAFLCVAAASAATWFGGAPLRIAPAYTLFLLAVIIAGYYGGAAPAVIATLLGAAAGSYIGLRQHAWVARDAGSWPALLAYVAAGLAIAALCERYGRWLRQVSEQRAEQQRAADDLRFTVAHQRIALQDERKRADQASGERDVARNDLASSQQRMTMAQEAARFWLLDWDISRSSVLVTGDLEPFGITGDEPPTFERLLQCVHESDRAEAENAVQRALHTHSSLDVETRVVRADGAIRWASVKGSTTYDHTGTPVRMIGVVQDVTEHKAAEEAIIRNEKLSTAGRLAAAIAHEINNPMAAVTNLLFIIKGDPTLSDSGREYLAMAERELDRATKIAKQTLGFYRESTEPAMVDLADLLNEVLAFHARHMPANITVDRRYAPGLHVMAIAGELRQVFSNLISNAVQAMSGGGNLRVIAEGVSTPAAGVRVSISDNGPGVRAEHLPLLFEPFFTTSKKAGTGLGLWVVKQIVQKHSGTIEVQTCTDDQEHGTSMRIFLPGAAARMSPQATEDRRQSGAA